MTKPGAWHGALVGATLTAAFVAVSFLGWTAAGLPFLPFDLFDWTARILPGSVVTAGIDSTVAISRALDATSLGAAAKTVEQAEAIGGVLDCRRGRRRAAVRAAPAVRANRRCC